MPPYLLNKLPEGSYHGQKPKAGLPKWGKGMSPINWFLLMRDTTKRFQEASFPICPYDKGVLDTGPKKLDYYVFLW